MEILGELFWEFGLIVVIIFVLYLDSSNSVGMVVCEVVEDFLIFFVELVIFYDKY